MAVGNGQSLQINATMSSPIDRYCTCHLMRFAATNIAVKLIAADAYSRMATPGAAGAFCSHNQAALPGAQALTG